MLLLDAIYINNSGGFKLLKQLVNELHNTRKDVYYLLDSRVYFDFLPNENATYAKASIVSRHLFYLRNKTKFTKVLTFGNVPPTIKLKIPVYTYFHNYSFLEDSIKGTARLKSWFIKTFSSNTSFWIVQTEHMKKILSAKFNLKESCILILPFFEDIILPFEKKSFYYPKTSGIRFIYVSDGHPYKNHSNLILAFSKYSKISPDSSLHLTIDNKHTELIKIIEFEVNKGTKIFNTGLIPFESVKDKLLNSDILVYPSLFESFGMGLIESAQLGLPICASDLPYVFDVVTPNSTFNPFSVNSIYLALLNSHKLLGKKATLNIKSQLPDLIEILSHEKTKGFV
jgi:glycosyltransferase involved in cell wall biosynthesis